MSGHTLIVMPDGDTWELHCDEPAKCLGWIECRKHHGNARWSAEDGPEECDEAAPWADQEEFTFHDEAHEWRSGWGWTVAPRGCVVGMFAENLPDDVYREHGADGGLIPGVYPIVEEWFDDGVVILEVDK